MAGQLQDAEVGAAEGNAVVLRADEHVSGEELLGKIGPAFLVGGKGVVGAVALRRGGDTGLDDLGRRLRVPAPPEVGGAAAVIVMGVRGEDPPDGKAVLFDHGVQVRPILLPDTGVDQDHVPVIEAIEAHGGADAHGSVRIPEDMTQFHTCAPFQRMLSLYTIRRIIQDLVAHLFRRDEIMRKKF